VKTVRHRFETFGGILALEDPPVLVHVDRDFMRGLGHGPSPLWELPESSLLSAPLEVHFSVTNACATACRHCYMDSGARDRAELSSESFRRAVDILAGMGVFHMALGGGEALERPDFFELATYVRSRGMVPNLTTNGRLLTEEVAAKCRIFGQVNISIDGLEHFSEAGRGGALAQAVRAVDLLLRANVKVGLNCVLARQSLDRIEELFSFAAGRGLTDLEFLRLKPAGRGGRDYREKRLTPAQHRELYPKLRELSRRYGIPAKIDCSFVPMFCWHRPDKTMMDQFSVYGCEAGNVLLGVRSDGRFAGCSFLTGEERIFDLPSSGKLRTPHAPTLLDGERAGALPVLRLPRHLQGGMSRRRGVRLRRPICPGPGVPVHRGVSRRDRGAAKLTRSQGSHDMARGLVALLALTTIYAVMRYAGFGGVSPVHIPAFLLNKAISMSAAIALALAAQGLVRGRLDAYLSWTKASGHLAFVHAPVARAHLEGTTRLIMTPTG
jgi:MoaA/NifB/PqqE/SkfB family radical SAM enzyme